MATPLQKAVEQISWFSLPVPQYGQDVIVSSPWFLQALGPGANAMASSIISFPIPGQCRTTPAGIFSVRRRGRGPRLLTHFKVDRDSRAEGSPVEDGDV